MTSVLNPRLGDEPDLARVGDHHPPDIGPDHFRHSARVAGGLHHDMVIVGYSVRENAARRSRVMPTRPSRRVLPSSSITASAKTRWMSSPTTRMRVPPRGIHLTAAGGQ